MSNVIPIYERGKLVKAIPKMCTINNLQYGVKLLKPDRYIDRVENIVTLRVGKKKFSLIIIKNIFIQKYV